MKLTTTSTVLFASVAFLFFSQQTAMAQGKIDKLIAKGDYQKAEQYCEKQSGESRKECFSKLADAYYTLEYYDKASAYYEKAGNIDGFRKLGDIYYEKKQYDESEEYYEKAYAENSEKLVSSYIRLAEAYYEIEDYEKSARLYTKSDYHPGYIKMGNVHYEKQEYKKAVEYYEKARIDTLGRLKESYTWIADAYFEDANYKEAEEFYKKAGNKKGIENIGDYYFENNEIEKTSELYNITAEIFRKGMSGGDTTELYYFGIWTNEKTGQIHKTATIGKQVWMVKNLQSAHFANGDEIPLVTGNKAWTNLSYGAYCIYDNDPVNAPVYGHLYNYYAVIDSRNICPGGWHVPSYDEFITLQTYLGGDDETGGKMKETGHTHWKKYNSNSTNESGFTGLPGGDRRTDGEFMWLGQGGKWWSVRSNSKTSWELQTHGKQFISYRRNDNRKGISVRCIKD